MTNLSVQQAAARARCALGEDFVSCFYDRVESALGVEVIVVPLRGDGYSLTLGGHKVIVLAATGHWFRSNFTLAHELGHLLVEGIPPQDGKTVEDVANAFAADLLMPVEIIRTIDWAQAKAATVARVIWDLFGGLGATDGGAAGTSFSSVQIGLRAQVQHLRAYADASATPQALSHPLVDTRFTYVRKGSATYVEHLGIQENPQRTGWAAAANYGNDLAAMIDRYFG